MYTENIDSVAFEFCFDYFFSTGIHKGWITKSHGRVGETEGMCPLLDFWGGYLDKMLHFSFYLTLFVTFSEHRLFGMRQIALEI